jgi:hypothetical protein
VITDFVRQYDVPYRRFHETRAKSDLVPENRRFLDVEEKAICRYLDRLDKLGLLSVSFFEGRRTTWLGFFLDCRMNWRAHVKHRLALGHHRMQTVARIMTANGIRPKLARKVGWAVAMSTAAYRAPGLEGRANFGLRLQPWPIGSSEFCGAAAPSPTCEPGIPEILSKTGEKAVTQARSGISATEPRRAHNNFFPYQSLKL